MRRGIVGSPSRKYRSFWGPERGVFRPGRIYSAAKRSSRSDQPCSGGWSQGHLVSDDYARDLKVVTVIFPDVAVGDTLVLSMRKIIHSDTFAVDSDTSCILVAQQASEVIGLVSAELVPYFPNGSTICRVTGLVVSTHHRGQGVGEKLVTGAADFARERHCSGIEITSAEHRLDAHRFYQRLGFSRTSFRFFHAL
jgi:GNAT superfamily N-acetyltransferase